MIRDWIDLCEAARRAYYHVTPTKNLPSIQQEGLKPSIGALSFVAGEARSRIYLFGHLEDVEHALGNWLGEYLPEDEPLALLKVILPVGVRPRRDAFEFQVFTVIPPENIEVLSTDIDNFNFDED